MVFGRQHCCTVLYGILYDILYVSYRFLLKRESIYSKCTVSEYHTAYCIHNFISY
ncbi:hypothetical protein BC940DRAFT_312639 [Gongronella butleri]|nr:hypothetical protein BC940DRAFT_312639 [Gongronella butleri]